MTHYPHFAFQRFGATTPPDSEHDRVECMLDYTNIIMIDPGKRGGRPCIRGMRISIADALGWLAAGMSHDEILSDYPELTEEDIRACLAFAAHQEQRFTTT